MPKHAATPASQAPTRLLIKPYPRWDEAKAKL